MRAGVWCSVAGPAALAASAAAGDPTEIIKEAMADAAGRTSLLQDTSQSGWDGAFFLRSQDGRFRLDVGGQVQFRYTATLRDGENEDGYQGGFETQRTTLILGGHAFDERLTYGVEAVFETEGGGFVFEVAKVGWDFGGGWTISAGLDSLPLLWEELLFDFGGLAVDQSVVNGVFGQGDSEGVFGAYTADRLRIQAAFTDGLDSGGTDFDESPADWALTGRAEWRFGEGGWDRFGAFSSSRGSPFSARIGVAGHVEEGADDIEASVDLAQWTVDVLAKGGGWNVYVAVVGRHLDDGVDSFSDFGLVAEGGVFVSETVELFARYDVVLADGDRLNNDPFHSITTGVNWFWHGQAAKLTADVAWFLDGTDSNDLVDAIAQPGEVGPTFGLLPSDDGSVALRVQFQLLF